jgi:hypothetical protein
MGLKEIKGSITPCIVFRRIAGRLGMSYKTPMSNGRLDARPTNGLIGKSFVKLNYDSMTASVIAKIGPHNDMTHFTGLINFQTGEMHLMEFGKHEKLAQEKGLFNSKYDLPDGWHGFTIYFTDIKPGLLEISPCSGQFGGIPIEHAPVFEYYMNDLSHNVSKHVLFYQSKYDRGLPEEKAARLSAALKAHNLMVVAKSMSNSELSKYISAK